MGATADEASVTSRLDFYKQPSWMRQWPYAHTVEITYRLSNGVLEVATAIVNLSDEPMPVAVGFHPYFQLTDAPRDQWRIAVGAKTRWLLDARKVPTGDTEPAERLLPTPQVGLRDYNLDEVFSDLVRDADGRATMTVWGTSQRLDVVLGPQLPVSRRVGAESVRHGPWRSRRLAAAGAELHLLRADGRHQQCAQHGAPGTVRRAADHPRQAARGGRASG